MRPEPQLHCPRLNLAAPPSSLAFVFLINFFVPVALTRASLFRALSSVRLSPDFPVVGTGESDSPACRRRPNGPQATPAADRKAWNGVAARSSLGLTGIAARASKCAGRGTGARVCAQRGARASVFHTSLQVAAPKRPARDHPRHPPRRVCAL